MADRSKERIPAAFTFGEWAHIEDAVHKAWANSLTHQGREHKETKSWFALWLRVRVGALKKKG